MDEGVDALSDEMEALDLPLIVEQLKLQDPLEKKSVSKLELFGRDFTLVHNPDAYHEFTVVPVVRLWEYSVE